VTDPVPAAQAVGGRVQARALVARARWRAAQHDVPAALQDLDAAVQLLAQSDPAERVPVYALRLTTMEEGGATPTAVRAWINEHRTDPAVALAAAAALSAGAGLGGQPAPALRLKRLDGKAGEIDLATLRGTPVVLEFFATWSKPSEITAVAVSAAQRRWAAKGVTVLSVSLDTKDTVAAIPAWIATHALAHPVIGEGLGWDSEVAAAWHVEAIPRLFLVDAQGVVVDADLSGATADEVGGALDRALESLLSGAAVHPASAPRPALPVHTAPSDGIP
jgi:peroxiredoxin